MNGKYFLAKLMNSLPNCGNDSLISDETFYCNTLIIDWYGKKMWKQQKETNWKDSFLVK